MEKNTTVQEEKKLLRSKIRAVLKEKYSDREKISSLGKSACKKILEDENYLSADIVLSYIPYGFELDSTFLTEQALKDGKKICVPRVEPDSSSMDFYFLTGELPLTAQLEKGSFGISEPKGTLQKLETDSTLNGKKIFMVVPGLAFTEKGARLGKGRGFYDFYIPRLIKSGCSLFAAGFCYREQVVEKLPVEDTDFFLHCLFTP